MDAILGFAAAGFGAIAGSFLGALQYRFNTGRGMGGRSKCDSCGHTLGVSDLVPVFSYLFLRGRCRYCGARIAALNFLIELAALSLSLLLWHMLGFTTVYAFWFVVWMTLLFTVVYDLRHTIIPLQSSVLLGALALASLFVQFEPSIHFIVPSLQALVAGPVLALPLFLLSFFSKGRWMGWGDWQLELSIGWFLGLSMGFSAFLLAFWSGAIVGIALLPFKKGLTMKSEIPFAPFLVLGMFIAYFFHVDFFPTLLTW